MAFRERLLEPREHAKSRREVPSRGPQAPGNASRGRAPDAAEPPRFRFPELDHSHRLVDPAELKERLRVVPSPRPSVGRTLPQCRRLPIGLAEALGGRHRVSAPERDEPRHRREQRRMEPDLLHATKGAKYAPGAVPFPSASVVGWQPQRSATKEA